MSHNTIPGGVARLRSLIVATVVGLACALTLAFATQARAGINGYCSGYMETAETCHGPNVQNVFFNYSEVVSGAGSICVGMQYFNGAWQNTAVPWACGYNVAYEEFAPVWASPSVYNNSGHPLYVGSMFYTL